MRTRFIHAADIHLGYEQYNLTARSHDFAQAYLDMVGYALEQEVEFVLLAGDLFHRASADAWMLTQATLGLESLRDARIPVFAVEGNHDVQHMRKHLSWMEFLSDQRLLHLLNIRVAANGHKALVPWDEDACRGSRIDIGDVRIYGIKYYGALTSRILEEIGEQIEPAAYTILMLHAGMQGQVPNVHGGLTLGDVALVRPRLDYLALGHVHKHLELEDWIYNPGSTETNSMEEFDWPHGFFDVQVDTDRSPRHTVKSIGTPRLRPFHRIAISAEHTPTIEAFVGLAEERIAAESGVPAGAVIELHLGGVAAFRRQDVPLARLKAAAEVRLSPLIVRVRNALVPPGLVTVSHGERLKRSDLERKVVEQLVYQQGEYRDRTASWTKLVLDVKNMAADRDLPASIVDHVLSNVRRAHDDPAEGIGQDAGDESALEQGGESPCMAQLFEEW